MSALDDIIVAYQDAGGLRTALPPKARAELAALRATVEAQARKLEEARKAIERCAAYIGSIDHGENTKSYMMCDAWLAANAPAPQVAYPFSVPDCPCVISEHPIKPCSLGCFHFTPDDYHDCANCGQPRPHRRNTLRQTIGCLTSETAR